MRETIQGYSRVRYMHLLKGCRAANRGFAHV